MTLSLPALQRKLAQAKRHVAEGADHIRRQRKRLTELRDHGHAEAATHAEQVLEGFEKAQAMHVADRDRLVEELGKNSDKATAN